MQSCLPIGPPLSTARGVPTGSLLLLGECSLHLGQHLPQLVAWAADATILSSTLSSLMATLSSLLVSLSSHLASLFSLLVSVAIIAFVSAAIFLLQSVSC